MEEQRAEVSLGLKTLNDKKESYKEFGNINERQEKRVLVLETKLYNLANFYLIFQGVILTAISQASSLKCHKWWIPFTLSLMTAMVNGFAFTYTLLKYVRTKKELETNRSERKEVQRQIRNLEEAKSNWVNTERSSMVPQPLRPDASRWRYHNICIGLAIFFLIAFTIVILAACPIVLCSHDRDYSKKDCCKKD